MKISIKNKGLIKEREETEISVVIRTEFDMNTYRLQRKNYVCYDSKLIG